MTNLNNSNGTPFAVSCWILWKSSNALIFWDIRWSVWQIINQVHILHSDVIKVLGHPKQATTTRLVSWEPLSLPFVKLNTNNNLGDSGFGGII